MLKYKRLQIRISNIINLENIYKEVRDEELKHAQQSPNKLAKQENEEIIFHF